MQRPGETYRRSTNQLPFTIAPAITITPLAAPAGSVTFAVNCSPQVWPQQQVALLISDQNIAAAPITVQSASLSFTATLAAGTYYVRLRVDGVDSLLVDNSVTPPVFDSTQKVTIA